MSWAKHFRLEDGRLACPGCHQPLGSTKIKGRYTRPSIRCAECGWLHRIRKDFLSGRSVATWIVSRAVREGLIPRAVECTCVDCGRPASGYDHRDYGLPMQIEPVCRSCNSKRGTAKPLNQLIVSALLLAHADQSAERAA